MKLHLFALAIGLLCCIAAAKAEDPVGRYTVITGTFTTSTGEDRRVILRMDTTTGETWTYESLSWKVKPNMNAVVEGWERIKADADSEWLALLKKFPNGKMAGPFKP